jgi:hypothetical protein
MQIELEILKREPYIPQRINVWAFEDEEEKLSVKPFYINRIFIVSCIHYKRTFYESLRGVFLGIIAPYIKW